MRISIAHSTVYRYAGKVKHSAQYLRLTPAGTPSQRVLSWRIDAPGSLTAWTDAFGNFCHTLVHERPLSEITIRAAGRVETTETAGVVPVQDGELPVEVFLRPTPLTAADKVVRDFAAPLGPAFARDRIDGLHRLMAGIRARVDYRTGATDVHSTAAEVLADGVGVCQDHAHVFIACCRALGVPARYVSGYLYDEKAASPHPASHAWAAAWVEHLGWVSFDIANAQCGSEQHVGLAVARDYAGAAPVRGIRHGGEQDEGLVVSVQVADCSQ